jgi:hypothetical protein
MKYVKATGAKVNQSVKTLIQGELHLLSKLKRTVPSWQSKEKVFKE